MILILALCLSGCLNFSSDLFTLPGISHDQAQLRKLINEITASKNWQSTSPQTGDNRYAVQFVDLYGDGISEAVTFFRNSKDFKLRVVIFSKTGSSSYSRMCSFIMDGDLIDTIYYKDLNGDGSLELIIKNRSESESLFGVNVYAIRNNDAALLLEKTCTGMVIFDLDSDMLPEILCLNNTETDPNAYAELFKYDTTSKNKQIDSLISLGTAPITSGMVSPDRITTGFLYKGMPVIIIDGKKKVNEELTAFSADIFACINGALENFSRNISFYTSRSNQIYCMDVDFDGFIEFPVPVKLTTSDKFITEDDYYQMWFSYNKDRTMEKNVSTYYSSKWYFIFPDSWESVYLLKTEDTNEGYTSYKFAFEQDERLHIALEIYVFNAKDKSTLNLPEDAFFLAENNESLFYAKIPASPDKGPLPRKVYLSSPAEVKQRFVVFDVNGVAQLASSK